MEKYTSFWDIVKDWRYYDSITKTKGYHQEFKVESEAALIYLTNVIKDILNCSETEKIESILEKIVIKNLNRLDKIVKSKKIRNVDEIIN